MKHAGSKALDQMADLLSALRSCDLKEPRPGVFYRRGKAFLHFHEDAEGLFADMRGADGWVRFPVNNSAQRKRLVAEVKRNPAMQ